MGFATAKRLGDVRPHSHCRSARETTRLRPDPLWRGWVADTCSFHSMRARSRLSGCRGRGRRMGDGLDILVNAAGVWLEGLRRSR